METATQPENSVHFENFELKLRTRELYCNGMRLKIRGHPVDVLAILLENPGELVTREELKNRLWPADTFVDFEQILNNSVGRLRDTLNDRAESPKFIETLPRLGYRFIAQVEKSAPNNFVPQFPPLAETPSPRPLATDSPKRHHLSMKWIVRPGIALAIGAFAASAYWYVHTPLPAPYISHYEQLTLDGTRKVARGTDGTRIYLNLREAAGGIGEIPVLGGKLAKLPIDFPGGSEPPVWISVVSPDGSKLLVISDFNVDEGFKVWVVGTLGHPVRYLIRAYSATWSPDGRAVIYANAHGDIYTISAEGGEPQLIHRLDRPSSEIVQTHDLRYSPDGKTIRFTRFGGTIWEMSSTGANFHEWLPGGVEKQQKCCGNWSPDGRFYFFLVGGALVRDQSGPPLGQIYVADERRGRFRRGRAEPILLASSPLLWGNPVPSSDGKKIFARGVSLRGELERYDPVSRRLVPYLNGISAEMVAFSRDGNYVAYVSFPDGILWRANRDGSAPVQLSMPPFYPRNPRWSSDGTQILFVDNTRSGVDALYTVPSQGGTPTRLETDGGKPQTLADWSPDGKRLVYTTDPRFSSMPRENGKIGLRIFELTSGKITVLGEDDERFYAPLWSPDGRYIAARSFDDRKLAIFDLSAGSWKILFESEQTGRQYRTGEYIGNHNWSHDGRFIHFLRWNDGAVGVYRVSVNGGNIERVFDLPEGFRGTGYYDSWMSLDPDDAPLIFSDVGTDEIYALTLEQR